MAGRARGLGETVRWIVSLTLLTTVAGLVSHAAADITYIYDELGRLRAVIDPSQTDGTAIYSYDAVGNILSITRQPASQVSLIEFNPKRGPVGSTVTIQGTGFSTTPSQNAVTFNGNRLTSIADSIAGTIGRSYDGLDRLTQETTPEGGIPSAVVILFPRERRACSNPDLAGPLLCRDRHAGRGSRPLPSSLTLTPLPSRGQSDGRERTDGPVWPVGDCHGGDRVCPYLTKLIRDRWVGAGYA